LCEQECLGKVEEQRWFEMGGLHAQVMEGMQEGTLFDRDVVESEEAASRAASTATSEDGTDPTDSGRDMAVAARTASRKLQSLPTEVCECHRRRVLI
jgi:hypothetical protein